MSDSPLINHISQNMMDSINLQARVCEFISSKTWDLCNLFSILPQRIIQSIMSVVISNNNIEDKMV